MTHSYVADLVLELFSEEIPAGMQGEGASQLKKILTDALKEYSIYHKDITTYVTPRRLVAYVKGLPIALPATTHEKRGPKVGCDPAILEAFLRAHALSLSDLTQKETKNGYYYIASFEEKGKTTLELLSSLIPEVIKKITWPKSMRWGEGSLSWVRPLRHILCLLDTDLVPFTLAGISTTRTTTGHRFASPETINIVSAQNYKEHMESRRVLLDPGERKEKILKQIASYEEKLGHIVHVQEEWLEEVIGLVEWPVVLLGSFPSKFLSLPPEVLSMTMRMHQRYASVYDKAQNIQPYFITVSHTEAPDGGASIIAGNERVLHARLEDALFFWNMDCKVTEEASWEALHSMLFHKELGSVAQKSLRMEKLVTYLVRQTRLSTFEEAQLAALSCKTDLSSLMVAELPELQGIMGYYYALEREESIEVATAIKEHYLPLGPSDPVPHTPTAIIVALADKLDSICGLFAVHAKPTGSKDPYALRRSALGIIRIISEHGLTFSLREGCKHALSLYDLNLSEEEEKNIIDDIVLFFLDRLKSKHKEKNCGNEWFHAIEEITFFDDILRTEKHIENLRSFLNTQEGTLVLFTYKRLFNFVGENNDFFQFDETLLTLPAEISFYKEIKKVSMTLYKFTEACQWKEALSLLASLCTEVNHFLDTVLIHCPEEDIRRNRLVLLSLALSFFHSVAYFQHLEGK